MEGVLLRTDVTARMSGREATVRELFAHHLAKMEVIVYLPDSVAALESLQAVGVRELLVGSLVKMEVCVMLKGGVSAVRVGLETTVMKACVASLATMEGNVLHQMFVPVGEDGVGHRVTFLSVLHRVLTMEHVWLLTRVAVLLSGRANSVKQLYATHHVKMVASVLNLESVPVSQDGPGRDAQMLFKLIVKTHVLMAGVWILIAPVLTVGRAKAATKPFATLPAKTVCVSNQATAPALWVGEETPAVALTAKGPVSMAIVPGLASVRASMGMKDNSVTEMYPLTATHHARTEEPV